MMRPDELREKVRAIENLERAVERLRKAETICSGQLYYNGHQGTKLTDDEVAIVRGALVDHYRGDVTIKAGLLRSSDIDPSSLLEPEVKR